MDDGKRDSNPADKQGAESRSSDEGESDVHPGVGNADTKWQRCTNDVYRSHSSTDVAKLQIHTETHNHFTALFPGPSAWASARRSLLLDFCGAMEDNRGRHTDHPHGCHCIRINQQPTSITPPPFLLRMPFNHATTFPHYPGLGQATNMAWFIPCTHN